MVLWLGCIADDFTGATDMASMLVKGGLRTVQTIGLPPGGFDNIAADAVVVALKSRSIPAEDAVAESLEVLGELRQTTARRFFFKYCSTFDSTSGGNIGPVAEALEQELRADWVPFCPALPVNGRTVFNGHLFVGDRLLNESGMENHPLNPMTDADLRRVLAAQSNTTPGLVPAKAVRAGAEAVRRVIVEHRRQDVHFAIVDCVDDADLDVLGEAFKDLILVTGGSGLGVGLARAWVRERRVEEHDDPAALEPRHGATAILSGSCSRATLGQIKAFEAQGGDVLRLDPVELAKGPGALAEAAQWAGASLGRRPIAIVASDTPEGVQATQSILGVEAAGRVVEQAFAQLAPALVANGVSKLVVAGGETAGAVVGALGVDAMAIGPEIDPGVPWTQVVQGDCEGLCLALKSGNFGAEDFFTKAFEVLG
ncbi:MAG: four-carbon acid sugar kinase family protein [Alphaproteobacteria bacterium]|nr:four-carbon acid sugar kinase family protein [Alphaproteobacteria bacterium]MCB9930890.1 four-carbon acid sugar kinase family protein [Alphaproteobacteria bacterium]